LHTSDERIDTRDPPSGHDHCVKRGGVGKQDVLPALGCEEMSRPVGEGVGIERERFRRNALDFLPEFGGDSQNHEFSFWRYWLKVAGASVFVPQAYEPRRR